MPRTLPWLLNQGEDRHVKRESTPRKRVKRERTPEDDAAPRKPPTSPENRDFLRSSQTPPTSPARPCPGQEFLIEGLDHDDAWVMVEDEFYVIAQSFTQHLHHAEYIRRKKEAKSKSAGALKGIQRPTDGHTKLPKEVERKKAMEALAARQKAGLAHLEIPEEAKDDSDADDDTWAGTHLHSLMTSPRRARQLMCAHAVGSSTKAAAGFGQPSGSRNERAGPISRVAVAHVVEINEETASDEDNDLNGETASEDDDLDGQARSVKIHQSGHVRTHSSTRTAQRRNIRNTRPSLHKTSTPKEEKVRVQPRPPNGFKSRVQMLFDDLDELPESSRSTTPSTSDMKKELSSTNNMTQNGPANDNLHPTKSRFNDVPTFLF